MKKRIDQSNPEIGFTWAKTDESYYIQDKTGNLMRVSDTAFALLERIAAGTIEYDKLDEETAMMVENLEGEYLRSGEPVVEIAPPNDIALWPRTLLFLILTGIGLFVTIQEWTKLSQAGELLHPLKFAAFVVLVIISIAIHESGHYFASRKYVDTSVGFRTVNGVVPAVVTDTTRSWLLPKNRRRWINLAGPFVELIWVCFLASLYYFVFPESTLLILLTINIFIQDMFALNPFIHGDGYFLLVDTFDLLNFRSRGFSDVRSKKITIPATYIIVSYAFGGLLTIISLYALTSLYGLTGSLYFLVILAIALFDMHRVKTVLSKVRKLASVYLYK